MSNRAGAEALVAGEAGLAAASQGSATLYIINLISSTTPMALEVPHAPELEGFAVFRSRRVEDGRDRFRLHLGYFDSAREAERVLPIVRAHYPAAWVALAPQDNMGSLDDTGVAQFRLIRQGRAAASRAPAAEPAPRAAAALPVAATPDPASSMHGSVVGRVPMTPAEVLELLESAPRSSAPAAASEESGAPAASAAGQQRFAVQLVWSTKPVLPRSVPQLAIFEAYTLYAVRVERAGRRWYGLRLGFFADPLSARQVALYARSDFSAAAVVPVSDRECARAAEVVAAAHTPPVAPVARIGSRRAEEIVLTPDNAQAPTIANIRRAQPLPELSVAPMPPGEEQAAQRRAVRSTRAVQGSAPKRRLDKTTEELLAELGANELAIDTSGERDELNDSGVRHLSVSIMTRQSPIARLLERVGRKLAH